MPSLLAALLLLFVVPVGAAAYYFPYSYAALPAFRLTYPTLAARTASVSTAAPSVSTVGTSQPATPYSGTPNSAPSTVDATLLSLLNRERTSRGLAPLQLDASLAAVARTKSQEMAGVGYFSHTSPTYGSPQQMLSRYGIAYSAFAENIARGTSAANIHASWMASPGHRANILNPAFTRIGIGVAQSGSGMYSATQLFIRP